MLIERMEDIMRGVALRKESVDRNLIMSMQRWIDSRSLSARRAWIEIKLNENLPQMLDSRSPQGERG